MNDQTPSFAPWVSKIRQVRAFCALGGFILVACATWFESGDWANAVLIGLAAALTANFLGWAVSLWIFAELHAAEVRNLRAEAQQRIDDRNEQIRSLYESRLALANEGGVVDFDQTMPNMPPMGERPAA